MSSLQELYFMIVKDSRMLMYGLARTLDKIKLGCDFDCGGDGEGDRETFADKWELTLRLIELEA